MGSKLVLFFTAWFLSFAAVASDGVVNISSDFSVKETANRFENIIKNKGLTLFTRIDHSKNAAKIDEALRPTELVLFGNPKIGTPLMQCSQQVAIDLPQKALIWEDENGDVWFSYNAPNYLSKRHNIEGCEKVLKTITNALGKLAIAASKAPK